MAERSLYEIMHVAPGAEPEVIEAAYRALMKKYHPDLGQSGAARYAAEINRAYAVLRDPHRRAEYDREERARAQQAASQAWAAQASARAPAGRPPAAAPQPVMRPGNGWTGWVAALLIAGTVYALWAGYALYAADPLRSGALAPIEAAAAEAEIAEPAALTVMEMGYEAAAPLMTAPLPDMPAPAPPVQELAPEPIAPSASTRISALAPRPTPAPRARPKAQESGAAPRARAAGPRSRSDSEFLEQQGYIY